MNSAGAPCGDVRRDGARVEAATEAEQKVNSTALDILIWVVVVLLIGWKLARMARGDG